MFALASKSTSSPGWVACVPQGGQAALALVEPASDPGAAARVAWVAEEPWSQPARALAKHRRQLARHGRVLVLGRGDYVCHTLDAPADLPREEWADAVRWQLKEAVEFPVETAALDVLAVPSGASYREQPQLIAVAAAADTLRPMMGWAAEAELRWQAVDIRETALRNLSALTEPEGRGQALLHAEDDRAILVVTYGGELLWTRQIEMSLTVTPELLADAAAMQRMVDHAALELQRSLDGIERSFGHVTLARLAITPMPEVQLVAERLGALLYVPVQPLELGEVLDFSAVPELLQAPARLNRLTTAIGAALREG